MRKKSIIAALMALTMGLSACAGSPAATAQQPAAQSAAAPQTNTAASQPAEAAPAEPAPAQPAEPAAPAEPVTIRMINRINAEVAVDNNPMYDHIEKLTGIRLEVEAPPINNYVDRLQVVMASGDLPDIIYTWNFDNNYKKWSADGLLLPVDEYLADYPNITKNITPAMFETARVQETGFAHAVPKANKVNRWGMVVNSQWLDKFGIEAPETIDELYEFGKRVATEDPDGNGQDDTFLYSPVSSEIDGVFGDVGAIVDAFLPNTKFGVPDFDGVYKIREKMNGYYPFLEFMNKLHTEKILDPEFFINKMYDDKTKNLQDRVALVKGHDSNIVFDAEWNNGGAFDKFEFMPPIQAEDGIARNYVGAAVWGGWCISADSENVETALKYIDWGNSPEGFEVLNYGIKGEHYNDFNLDERTIDRTAEQETLVKTVLSSYTSVSYAYDGMLGSVSADPVYVQFYSDLLDNYFAKVTEVPVPSFTFTAYDDFLQKNPDIATQKVEYENKYIIGDISMDELKRFIDEEYLPLAAEYEAAYLELTKEF